VTAIGEATTKAEPVIKKEPGTPRDIDSSRITKEGKRK
jgi:hypothetical protein